MRRIMVSWKQYRVLCVTADRELARVLDNGGDELRQLVEPVVEHVV